MGNETPLKYGMNVGNSRVEMTTWQWYSVSLLPPRFDYFNPRKLPKPWIWDVMQMEINTQRIWNERVFERNRLREKLLKGEFTVHQPIGLFGEGS